jgi:transposase-like protein
VDTIMTPDRPIRRRRHSPEFKSQLVAAARQPGASVAGIALAHGINANLLHRWMRETQGISEPRALVPVRIEAAQPHASHETINLTITGQGVQVSVRWPLSDADGCARLLRALLT